MRNRDKFSGILEDFCGLSSSIGTLIERGLQGEELTKKFKTLDLIRGRLNDMFEEDELFEDLKEIRGQILEEIQRRPHTLNIGEIDCLDRIDYVLKKHGGVVYMNNKL